MSVFSSHNQSFAVQKIDYEETSDMSIILQNLTIVTKFYMILMIQKILHYQEVLQQHLVLNVIIW